MSDFRLSLSNSLVEVNVRIETGDPGTSREHRVQTRGHDVRPEKGPARRGDGTSGNEFPLAGPTCLTALDDASRLPYGPRRFTWEGTYKSDIDDLSITTINTASAISGQKIWSLWVNFTYMNISAGQVGIKNGDSILWALIPEKMSGPVPASIPLKLIGPRLVQANTNFIVTVINGSDPARSRVPGATVKYGSTTFTTDTNGKVLLKLAAGSYTLKATKGNDIASNSLWIQAT